MLRSFGSSVLLGLIVGVSGCAQPGPLFADIQYATRCEETLHCAGPQDHDICGPGCAGVSESPSVGCNVVEADPSRTITFSARQSSGASISVSSLVVPFAGGAAMGGACRVTIVEGANTYVGSCGGSVPSDTQPCQITEVSFTDDEGNPTLEGKIFCEFLAHQASPALQIEVTAIGTGPGPAGTPGRFRLANCTGLHVSG